MKLLIGICLALSIGGVTSALAKPSPKEKKAAKTSAVPKVPVRKALMRKIAEDAGILGTMRNSGMGAFGSVGKLSLGGDFRTADAAYERADWAKALALYAKGDVLGREQTRFGPSRAMTRYGHVCQALGRRACAVEAADAEHRAGRTTLGGFARGPDRGSRVSRVMGDLLSKRRRARRALDRNETAEADELFLAVYKADPRCPGQGCPPFVLRETSAVYARSGRMESAKDALGAYLKAVPRDPERQALKRQMKTWAKQARQKKTDEAAAFEASQVRVPKAGKAAPWLKTAQSTPTPRFTSIAYGGRVGIAHLRAGKVHRWMGVRWGSAMVDRLAIPDGVEWVAVGGDEHLYYATKKGALHRATLETAQARFKAIGKAPRASQWDVQGSTVVASSETQVWVWSKGATAPHVYTHPDPIGSAWARVDGVVVFGDAKGANVSTDGGRSWTHTALGDMRRLQRHGQRVAQRHTQPMPGHKRYGRETGGSCAQGELTGGLKWVVPGDRDWRHETGWAAVFSVEPHARAARSLPDGAGRVAASGGDDAAAEIAKCRADRKAYFDAHGGGGGTLGRGNQCDGLGCLDALPLPATPVRFGLLGDGQCAEKSDADAMVPEQPRRASFVSRGPSMCAGLTRVGTVVRATATQFDVGVPIANCAPMWVRSVAGIGLVSCLEDGGARALVVLDGEGVERERQQIKGRAGQTGVAADGTITVAVRGESSTDGAIRRPVALGEQGAWRIDAVGNAQVWRPVSGGHAIALTPGSKGEPVFKDPRIQRKRADGKRDYTRWSSRRTAAVKACHAVAYAADPTLAGRLILTGTIDDAGTLTAVVADNRLRGESEALLACIMGVLQADAHPKSAATETVYLTFGAKNNSLRAVLTAPGKPAKALTEDVVFERAPQQIRALSDGSVSVTPRRYPAQTCLLPKVGELLCSKKQ